MRRNDRGLVTIDTGTPVPIDPPELDPRWEWVDVSTFGQMPGTEYVRGMCNHLEAIPVESIVTGETVAHLCLTCDTQLPA